MLRRPSRHIPYLWNNKIEIFDRTLLMLYYNVAWKASGIYGTQCRQIETGWENGRF